MSARKTRVYRVVVEGGDLVLAENTERSRISSSSIRRVGTTRKYSRVLVILVIVMAVISIYTQDPFHTVLTLIMLGVTLSTREEVLIVETNEGRVLEISARDRKSVKKAAEDLSKLLTH